MRFSYVTTLAFEKYGIVLILSIGFLFCVIVDSINPFYIESEFFYYLINVTALMIGLLVGIPVYIYTKNWMRKRTIWRHEFENESGNRTPLIQWVWNILVRTILVISLLVIVAVIITVIFYNIYATF